MTDEPGAKMAVTKTTKTGEAFDVIIVGGGPAGLFAAYYLGEHSDLKVLVIEKGKAPLKRECPINETQTCIHCKPCNILCGVGGAGLFSDGKLNYIYKLGKTDLTQFMSIPDAQALIDETEAIFNRFGMDAQVYPTDMATAKDIRKKAKRYGVDLLIIKQKHLGSDRLPAFIADMADYIKSRGVSIHTSEEVRDVVIEDGRVRGVVTNRKEYQADNVILAPGRVGADWVGNWPRSTTLGWNSAESRWGYAWKCITTSCATCVISSTTRPFSFRPANTTMKPEPFVPTRGATSPSRITRNSCVSTGTLFGTRNQRTPILLFCPK